MTPQDMISSLETSGQYKVLRKLGFTKTYTPSTPETKLFKAAMLDVETTGLRADKEEITNLAVFQFTYDETGKIYSIVNFYDGFQEPKKEIPERVQRMTGITPAMCKGKSLDIKKIEAIFSSSEFVIAHNAQFDRSFVDRAIPISKDTKWCCTQRQIPWDEIGAENAKLVTIATHYGFFYDAHQARPDCLAGIEILSKSENNKTNLSHLIDSINAPVYLVQAIGSPFEKKDDLKDAGYAWKDNPKMWWKLVYADQLEEEKSLLSSVYPKNRNTSVIELLDRKDLFK